jgi:hypothetical protein
VRKRSPPWCMPPGDSNQNGNPARHEFSRHKRRCLHQQARRPGEREQLLLVSSELDAAAVSELAAQERRVIAGRNARRDCAAVLACADRVRARAGCPSPLCTPPAVDDAVDVPALAERTLRDTREQSALEHRLLSRLAAGLERAPRCQLPSPAPSASPPAAIRPAPGPGASAPASGPGPSSSAQHTLLELSCAGLERAVASLEAVCTELGRHPRTSVSPARPAAHPLSDPAELFFPDGTTVAHALAARYARIAQLLFEIEDRGARQLETSLGRAAAFLRDPSNLLAAPPPEEPASEPVSPRARDLPQPLRGEQTPSSPPRPARNAKQLSWRLGLARSSPPHCPAVSSDRPGLAEPPVRAPAPSLSPWA